MATDEELAPPSQGRPRPNLLQLQSGLGISISTSVSRIGGRRLSENPLPLRKGSSRLDLSLNSGNEEPVNTLRTAADVQGLPATSTTSTISGGGDDDKKADETMLHDSGQVDTPASSGTTPLPLPERQSVGVHRPLSSSSGASAPSASGSGAFPFDTSFSLRSQSRGASHLEPDVEASAEPATNTSPIGEQGVERGEDRDLDMSGTSRLYKHALLTSPKITATARAMATATATEKFPAADVGVDSMEMAAGAAGGDVHDLNGLDRLLARMPSSVWQPNTVVVHHRRPANYYWGVLLMGYLVYIVISLRNTFESRNSPPVQISLVEEPYQLPDVGFCFEGDTYDSRFGCFDGNVSDGRDCADSLRGDVFVYGYNRTGYTTPEGYSPSEDFVVLLPTKMSETCIGFSLSTLAANTDAPLWNFHMLMFWNSSYDPTENRGAFESIKMYLYGGGMTSQERKEVPITLYAPISFEPSVVPFVRGFLTYEQHEDLTGEIDHKYLVVDTTSSQWHNAEDAVGLAADYGTDALASIQLDIRSLSYYRFSEVDPVDLVGTLGEISGFWLVVPLLFGVLFYRPQASEDLSEMRSFDRWRCRKRVRGQGDIQHQP